MEPGNGYDMALKEMPKQIESLTRKEFPVIVWLYTNSLRDLGVGGSIFGTHGDGGDVIFVLLLILLSCSLDG